MSPSEKNLLHFSSDNKKFIGAIYEQSAHGDQSLRDIVIKKDSTEREVLGWVFTVAILMAKKPETDSWKNWDTDIFKEGNSISEQIYKNRIRLFKRLLLNHAQIKGFIKNHIKEVNESIETRMQERRKHDSESSMRAWEDFHIEELVWYKEQLKKALIVSETLKDNPTITDADINRAKEYPITELVEFKNNFAKCLWHEEKTGSMKYYPLTNSTFCFGCSKSADAISVYRKLNGASFIEAVRFLIK